MALIIKERSYVSNTSFFSNLCLLKCFRKCKSKSYLRALLLNIEKDLNVTQKRLGCLKLHVCRGVHLRKVKIKGLTRRWQLKEKTILSDLSNNHEVCFRLKSAFKVVDTCLWYLDNGCSRYMTGDRSLFKNF